MRQNAEKIRAAQMQFCVVKDQNATKVAELRKPSGDFLC